MQLRKTMKSRLRILLLTAACVLCASACSLVSLKSPEKPLSTRDLNARILTREYSADFIAAVEQCADQIALSEADPAIMRNALRWKISTTSQSQRAAQQLAPMMGVLDTWVFAAQMKEFLSPQHPGGALFGAHQESATAVAGEFAQSAESMARQLATPKEFQQFQKFVTDYTNEHPLQDLKFVRPSVVQLWVLKGGPDLRLVDSLGTIPEALADTSDRLRMLGETLPSQSMWRTELALQESGASSDNVRAALLRLDERLARMSAAAEAAPQLVHEAVADVRRSVLDVLNRLDASSAATIQALRIERAALSTTVSTERAALLSAADLQRKAITVDVGNIADRIVASSGEQVRHLAREVLLLLVLFAMVVLGLPFAAGYLVGRNQRPRPGTAGH